MRKTAWLPLLITLLGFLLPQGAGAQSGETITLIPQGSASIWRYFDQGVSLGTAWRNSIYPLETNWLSGPAQLGFGDGDEATVVSGGPAGLRYITTYFRRSFVVNEGDAITNLTVQLLRDDGGVVYLNGTDVFRSNMPQAPTVINFSTLAPNASTAGDETNYFAQAVNPTLLVPGTNILAVEIHQNATNSADLSFDLRLIGIRVPRVGPPSILTQPQNTTVFAGSNTTLRVVASGAPPLRFQWSFQNKDIEGATNSTLVFNPAALTNAGVYRVQVSNSLGSVLSTAATLSVIDFNAGIFEDCEPDIHQYFWSQFGGTVLATNYGGSVSGVNSMWFGGADPQRFAVTRPLNTDSGGAISFYIRMGNSSGTFWELPDLPGEGIVVEYSTDRGTNWSNLATYDTAVFPNWTLQFLELPVTAQAPETMFRWRQLGNSGESFDHWALDDIAIAVGPSAARILGQPTDQVSGENGTVTFAVGAAGSRPITFQWRFNGTDLLDATNTTLLLTNLTLSQAGQYSVFVSNSLGSVLSSNATLTVETLGQEFRIAELSTNNSFMVENLQVNGTERAGFAVGHDQLLYAGDSGLAGLSLNELEVQTMVSSLNGMLSQDFESGIPYALGNSNTFFLNVGGSTPINTLHELSPATGRPTGRRLPLTTPIPQISSYGNFGVFSGYGRVVIYNGSRVYNISTRSGLVTDLGAMTIPLRVYSGNGAFWGVAEYFSNAVHLVYVADARSIVRTQVPTGGTTNLLTTPANSQFNGGALGSMSHFAVSPNLNRWYFHTRGSSVFGAGNETLGYASASFIFTPTARAPVIVAQPADQVVAASASAVFRVGVSGTPPFAYQWQYKGADIVDATNRTLNIEMASSSEAGSYSVRITNETGSTGSSNALLTIAPLPIDKFQITKLATNNPFVIEHAQFSGDNRGAIAIASNQVFYSGDSSTARFNVGDLSGGATLGVIYDALVSDLQTERVYSLANGTNALQNSSASNLVTHLLEHNSNTGLLTGTRIALSSPIVLLGNFGQIGFFSGYGRFVLHDGTNVYHVALPSGQVTPLGNLPRLTHTQSESWAYWGVAEFFNSALHLVYVRNSTTVERTRVSDGFTTVLGRFTGLGNMAAFTVSPNIGRWYFHYSGSSLFGTGDESLGFAEAVFKYSAPPLPPRILIAPSSQTVALGSEVQLKVGAAGTAPLSYRWQFNGNDIVGATGPSLTLDGVTGTEAGVYSIIVSNAYGLATNAQAILNVATLTGDSFRIATLTASNVYAIEHRDLTGFDRGGIAASSSRIFYNGNTASAGYTLLDLAPAGVLPIRGDAMASDLRSEVVYHFGNGTTPVPYGGGVATSLIQMDSYSGQLTTNTITLSSSINLGPAPGNVGFFSGYGRIVVHNGSRAYDIVLPSGEVTELGVMSIPVHNRTSGWAYWGVAEFHSGLIHLVLVQDSVNVVRVRVPDGAVSIIQTFSYLGSMNCITVAPYLNRWYFHHEFSSQFTSGFTETLGFADATFELNNEGNPPVIIAQPLDLLAIQGRSFSLTVGAGGTRPMTYQWQHDGIDLPGATNATLFIQETAADMAGTYRVSVSNAFGAAISRNAIVGVRDLFALSRNFSIAALTTNNSRVVDHNNVTGDDRGGIAVSGSSVFYSGDTATARFAASDLSGGASLGRIYDSLVSNLRTETVYTLANGLTPLTRDVGGIATTLIQLDGSSGALTGNTIPLSSPIVLSTAFSSSIGFFSGYDRIVIYNGQRLYSIELPDGTVFDHGSMVSPVHQSCENWAYWGIAEQFNNSIYITYVRDVRVARTRVPDGFTEFFATFNSLGDMCSFTVSPARNKWFFHHEGASQFGGSNETLGSADAVFDSPLNIAGLFDTTLLEDTNLEALPFRVYDAAGHTNISVSGVSSNANLVANTNIFISGSGTNWALTVRPFANSNGSTVITITAQVGTNFPVRRSFTLFVAPVNDPPFFTMPASLTLNEDAGFQYYSDWITNLTVGPAGEPSGQSLGVLITNDNPALFSSQPYLYAYTFSRFAALQFSTDPNAFGTANVSITINDNGGNRNGGRESTTQTFSLTVQPINDRPSFQTTAAPQILEDSGPQVVPGWAYNISAGPYETNQALTFITVLNNPALFAVPPAIDAAGNLTYTVAPDTYGSSFVQVFLQDDGGTNNLGRDTSFTGFLTIDVLAVNDPPLVTRGPDPDPVVLEDSGLTVISNWVSAISPGPANESSQTVAVRVTTDQTNLFAIQPTIDPDGSLSFAPAINAFGIAIVLLQLQDNGGTDNGGNDTTLVPFTITILPVNDQPTFTGGADQTVLEDAGPQTVVNWAQNISFGPTNESGQALTLVVSNSNPQLFSSQPMVSPTGTLSFTSATNANGTAIVFVTPQDDGGITNSGIDSSATTTFRITVAPVNDRPSANSQTIVLDEGSSAAITLSGFDIEGDLLSYTIAQPAHGTLGGTAPNLIYTPEIDYSGPDSFTFEVSDGALASPPATITLTIRRVNDAPVAVAQISAWTLLGTNRTNATVIAANNATAWILLDGSLSTDPENDPLSMSWQEQGKTNLLATGANALQLMSLGAYAITLTVSDGLNLATDSIHVEVVTATEIVERIKALLETAQVTSKSKKMLLPILDRAAQAFGREKLKSGLKELGSFQKKVESLVYAENHSLAEQLNRKAQEVIDALDLYPAPQEDENESGIKDKEQLKKW